MWSLDYGNCRSCVKQTLSKVRIPLFGIIDGSARRVRDLRAHRGREQPGTGSQPVAPLAAGRDARARLARGPAGRTPDRSHDAAPGADRSRPRPLRQGPHRAGRLRGRDARCARRAGARPVACCRARPVRPPPCRVDRDRFPRRPCRCGGRAVAQRPQRRSHRRGDRRRRAHRITGRTRASRPAPSARCGGCGWRAPAISRAGTCRGCRRIWSVTRRCSEPSVRRRPGISRGPDEER